MQLNQVTTARLLRWFEQANSENDQKYISILQRELDKRDLKDYDQQQAEIRFEA